MNTNTWLTQLLLQYLETPMQSVEEERGLAVKQLQNIFLSLYCLLTTGGGQKAKGN